MIHLVFPIGCYGHYFRKCIYAYTDIVDNQPLEMLFEETGSSHDNVENLEHKIGLHHHNSPEVYRCVNEDVITILPTVHNKLDYFNNQFLKCNQLHILKYLNALLDSSDVYKNVFTGWGYPGIDSSTPNWVIREFISFWIKNVLNDSYSIETYTNIPCLTSFTTTELFSDIIGKVEQVSNVLNLKINVTESAMLKNHVKFKSLQRYHGSQLRCEFWVNEILHSTKNSLTSCKTIFDEAYVQHLLREQGFEIRCHGLNEFPLTANKLRELLYKNEGSYDSSS